MKKIYNIIKIIVISAVVTFAVITAAVSFRDFKGFKLFIVTSGSMEPAIRTGSIIAISRTAKFHVNDIVTFTPLNDLGSSNPHTTTHRITGFGSEGKLVTKGDANNANDPGEIDQKQVLGKMLFCIPYIGYIILFSKTQTGMMFLIVVPSTLIIHTEIQRLIGEIRKMSEKRKGSASNFGWTRINPLKYASMLILLPLVIPVGNNTDSFYFYRTKIEGMTLSAATVFADPEIDISLSDDEKSVHFSVKNIASYESVQYILSYHHTGPPQAVSGTIVLNGENAISRDIVLGTCSAGSCTYHKKVNSIKIEVTLTDRIGNIKILSSSL